MVLRLGLCQIPSSGHGDMSRDLARSSAFAGVCDALKRGASSSPILCCRSVYQVQPCVRQLVCTATHYICPGPKNRSPHERRLAFHCTGVAPARWVRTWPRFLGCARIYIARWKDILRPVHKLWVPALACSAETADFAFVLRRQWRGCAAFHGHGSWAATPLHSHTSTLDPSEVFFCTRPLHERLYFEQALPGRLMQTAATSAPGHAANLWLGLM